MNSLLKILIPVLGLSLATSVNAQTKKPTTTAKPIKDTTIAVYSNDTLKLTKYLFNSNNGDMSKSEEIYVFNKNIQDKYLMKEKKVSQIDSEGKLIFQSKNEFEYTETEDKYDKNKKVIIKSEKSFTTKTYHYDKSGKLVDIVSKEAVEVKDKYGKGKGELKESVENFLYLGKNEAPLKWDDANGNKNFDDGEKLYIQDAKTKEWVKIESKK